MVHVVVANTISSETLLKEAQEIAPRRALQVSNAGANLSQHVVDLPERDDAQVIGSLFQAAKDLFLSGPRRGRRLDPSMLGSG